MKRFKTRFTIILPLLIATVLCLALTSHAISAKAGDMNGDSSVTSDDAILLLRHTLSPTAYPIHSGGDTNCDGNVNSDDAIYLLRHTLDPKKYPVPAKKDFTIPVKEDTYAYNTDTAGNDMSSKNFGADTEIHLKSSPTSPIRYGYLKFDISSLKDAPDFTCIQLDLTLTTRQTDSKAPYASVEVYGCPTSWSESTLTYKNMPEYYGFVDSNTEIGSPNKVYSFFITDYVRKALAKGETEISLYLREATEAIPLHTRFASKEAGEAKAPKLSVYYGTKTDNGVYDEHSNEPALSENGLDRLLGLNKKEILTFPATEDAYVEAGTSASTKFGSSSQLIVKTPTNAPPDVYYRVTLLKFDISDVPDGPMGRAVIRLNCTTMETPSEPTSIKVYACDPSKWDESSVNYLTLPTAGKLLTTATVVATGSTYIDVTDYIAECKTAGITNIAFYLKGDIATPRKLVFTSIEGGVGAPALQVYYGSFNFTTYLKYDGENPWQVAMDAVTEWLDRWEVIKKGGDPDTETVKKISSEYSLKVDACLAGQTDGYNTRYTSYSTRNISTLKGYTASSAEVEKYDVYGGLMDESMRQTATGYFYTTKIGDRWWTIDPLGYPFFKTAVVSVTIGNSNQKAVMLKKYGSTSAWAQATTDRLFDLGFNSTGGWSSLSTLIGANAPLAQTQIIGLVGSYASSMGLNVSQSGNTDLVGNVLPVFDPEFAKFADSKIKDTVSRYANSPNIYGWMSDNELPDKINMLDNSLAFDTSDKRFFYSYATAWTFMYLKTGKANVSVADVTDELRKEYRAMVYDKLFSETCTALDKYDPNHQFMGARFLRGCYTDEYVLRVSGYWCDVITLNYYSVWQPDPTVMANIQRWAGKPFVITEWYAKGMDVWEADNRMTNKSGAGWTVRTQADRGKFYQNYALQLLECKGCVGFDWFKYWDNDPTDLTTDLSNRNANKGILANNGEEYTDLTDYMYELNSQKYNLISFFDAR